MAKKCWTLLVALSLFSTARSACAGISDYLNVPMPLEGDTTIELGVTSIECPDLQEEGERLEEIVVTGGALTLSSTEAVSFANLRFTVEDGASLVFDMPLTSFGPSTGDIVSEGDFMVDVKEGGAVTFTGKFESTGVVNVLSVFYNAGSVEFKDDSIFKDNGSVFRSNTGTLKFRGDATFKDNMYLPISNIESGFVRFSKTAVFDTNGFAFGDGDGCAVNNGDAESTVSFRGDAVFTNHKCDFAGAVFNAGRMGFYGKAYFDDNVSYNGSGGGLGNIGTVKFRGAAQFNNNICSDFGGGLSVSGGDVIFFRGARFTGNHSSTNGGAFSVRTNFGYGSLTFKKPSATRFTDNVVGASDGCPVGYVKSGATLVGYTGDDVCVTDIS